MPDSKVYLGRVPFDSSYRHTIWFGSASAQTSEMLSHMTTAFSDEDYTFIREGGIVRVPVNADSLNGYNYLMYNNGNKWYYNFISAIEYLNEGTTAIHFTRDVFQTWMFDYDKTACYVEREHVADDTRYVHTVPEPKLPLEQTYNGVSRHIYTPDYVVVQTTEYPHYMTQTIEATSSDAVSGGLYHGVYSASLFLMFDVRLSVGRQALHQFMTSINAAGAAEAITNVIAVCDDFLNAGDVIPLSYEGSGWIPSNNNMMQTNTTAPEVTYTVNQLSSLDGYTPRNNKLFCYPFTYCEMGDYSGKTADLLFELSSTDDHHLEFRMRAPLSTNMQGIIRMWNYNGSIGGLDANTFVVDLSQKLPWTYDTFANWASQNVVSNALNMLGSAFSLGLTLANPAAGASAAVTALGAGQAITGAASSLGNMATMAQQPNKAMGNVNGDVRLGTETWGWYTRIRVPRAEYARIWDDFFDMYGYEVDRIKVPEFTSRPSWNYVKLANCPYNGNVNPDDMAQIQNIYNAGVTLWHTWDVGNYSLSNGV